MKFPAFLAPLALAIPLAACGGPVDNSTAAAPVAGTAAPAGQDWTQTVAKTAEGFVMGNPNAPIKLVEYGSRLCPTCKAFADQGYPSLKDTYVKSGKVSFEFRDYLLGAQDVPVSVLGRCVGADAFFPLMAEMFGNQQQFVENLGKADPAIMQRIESAVPAERFQLLAQAMGSIDFMKQRGLPEDRARACLADTAEIDRLTKSTQDKGPGGDGTVTGTPTFLLNDSAVPGAVTWAQVEEALKKAGA